MRPLLAALATTALPAALGQRMFSGRWPVRWGVGGLFGIAVLALTGVVGALFGALLVGAGVGLVALALAGRRPIWQLPQEDPPAVMRWILPGVLATGGLLLLLSFWRLVPQWDAWQIWSMKAKALADQGNFRGPIFRSTGYLFTQQNYPPLFPTFQAIALRAGGDLHVTWPLQFQLAWVWTLGALALTGIAGRWRGLAPIVLLAWIASPAILIRGMSGLADVPMAVFLVTGLALVVAWPERALVPATVLVVAAGLTKYEGAIFAVAASIAMCASRPLRRRAIWVGLSVVVTLVAWRMFASGNGMHPNIVKSGTPTAAPAAGAIFGRLGSVVPRMARFLLNPTWGLAVVLGGAAVLRGRRGWPTLAVVLVLGFLVGVYVVTADVFVERILSAPVGLLCLAGAWAAAPAEGGEVSPAEVAQVTSSAPGPGEGAPA